MIREDIIRRIVERERQHMALTLDQLEQEEPALITAACEQFGTWEIALRYAGVSPRSQSKRANYTADHVQEEIRKLCIDGFSLNPRRAKQRDKKLYQAAVSHYGSWRKALAAVGISQPISADKPRKLNREEIIAALRQRNDAGLSLSWSIACVEDHELATAAKHAFITWRRALVAAGLPSQKTGVPRRWTTDRLIAEILDRHKSGKSLAKAVVVKENRPLYWAAYRMFGNWETALATAGIPTLPEP